MHLNNYHLCDDASIADGFAKFFESVYCANDNCNRSYNFESDLAISGLCIDIGEVFNSIISLNVNSGPALIRDILRKYPQNRKMARGGKRMSEDLPFRLIDRHFISKCDNRADVGPSRRKCVVCTNNKRRRETRYKCKKCDVGLCIDQCFKVFHTQLNY
ncbi:PiggyBac transposable element-derived protein 4 [Anthophora quadrimaculata]